MASFSGCNKVVEILLTAGAQDHMVRDIDYALSWAIWRQDDDTILLFEKACIKRIAALISKGMMSKHSVFYKFSDDFAVSFFASVAAFATKARPSSFKEPICLENVAKAEIHKNILTQPITFFGVPRSRIAQRQNQAMSPDELQAFKIILNTLLKTNTREGRINGEPQVIIRRQGSSEEAMFAMCEKINRFFEASYAGMSETAIPVADFLTVAGVSPATFELHLNRISLRELERLTAPSSHCAPGCCAIA